MTCLKYQLKDTDSYKINNWLQYMYKQFVSNELLVERKEENPAKNSNTGRLRNKILPIEIQYHR